jgi:hypothetical protein
MNSEIELCACVCVFLCIFRWDSAILWSGQCYPLKTNAFIEKKLIEWKGRNIGEAWGRGLT